MEEIKNRIQQYGLTIKRVPRNTLNRFKELASNEEFCRDYGMALKYLLDFHDGIVVDANEQIKAELIRLSDGLDKVKEQIRVDKEEEKKPTKSMLNGKGVVE